MPLHTIQKELLVHMSLFLGSGDRKRLSCTAKPFKNLDIEKALCSESVTVDYYLLKKIRCYPLNIATDRDAEQPRSAEKISAIKELVIASDAIKVLTNDDLEKLAKLGFIHEKNEVINLGICNQITDLSPLASCTALTNLKLPGCTRITNLSPLASCTALTSLDLRHCHQITNQILSTLPVSLKLTSLNLSWCRQITNLSPIANCTALTNLYLSDSTQITDLSPLTNCTALTSLDLRHCHQITDLRPLVSCTELKNLNLHRCNQITDLSPLTNCTALTNLYLNGCFRITDLSPLANHPTLSELIGPDGEEVDLTSLSNTQQPGP